MALWVVLATAGCSMDPTRIPIPGANVSGSHYSLSIEFSSVLNLSARAKVRLGGVDIGVMDNVSRVGNNVLVTVDISASAVVPRDIHVELRQASILGDIYIEFIPAVNSSSVGVLHDGDTIQLCQTKSSESIESQLRSLSNILNGGLFETFQKATSDFNKVFPSDPATLEQLLASARLSLHDLAVNEKNIDEILTAAERNTRIALDHPELLPGLLEEGPLELAGVSAVIFSIMHMLIEFGNYANELNPVVVPLLPSAQGILDVVFQGHLRDSSNPPGLVSNVNDLLNLVRNQLIPFFSKGIPQIVITGVVSENDLEKKSLTEANNTVSLMRSIGLLP
ncbi:MAG: MlaD family protein [Mycobacteriaceae bacterium]